MPDCVSPASLDWALSHIERFGDTDIFPVPFEYYAIKANWDLIRAHLAAVDLEAYEVSSPAKLLIPKVGGGYRAATQLDPFDSLLFTAIGYESAPQIENFRKPKADHVACAFRVELDSKGQLFGNDSGWKDYHSKTAQLIASGEFNYILCADISDYYNQASHHRIQNALSAAGIPESRSKNIEQFLSRLNALHHSKGIPVGPSTGILLGEVCLADVDVKLERKRFIHARYVDDFRIFCDSMPTADRALHELSEYLFTAHRLSLHPGKTRILDVSTFVKEELFDPEQTELETKRDKVAQLLKELRGDKYGDVEGDEIDEADVDFKTLKELFMKAVSTTDLNQGLARYALRKATALRSRVFLNDVLTNLEKLAPVYRDTIRYLLKVGDRRNPQKIGSALVHLLSNSRVGFLPFIQVWTFEAFSQQPALCGANKALELAESCHPLVRDRLCAIVARAYRMSDWVRERKENWHSNGPWSHRAILWAGNVLPPDERRHWLKSAFGHPLLLTSSVAKIAAG
jgi:hypothetical protein